jgi:hypothetical protein
MLNSFVRKRSYKAVGGNKFLKAHLPSIPDLLKTCHDMLIHLAITIFTMKLESGKQIW